MGVHRLFQMVPCIFSYLVCLLCKLRTVCTYMTDQCNALTYQIRAACNRVLVYAQGFSCMQQITHRNLLLLIFLNCMWTILFCWPWKFPYWKNKAPTSAGQNKTSSKTSCFVLWHEGVHVSLDKCWSWERSVLEGEILISRCVCEVHSQGSTTHLDRGWETHNWHSRAVSSM